MVKNKLFVSNLKWKVKGPQLKTLFGEVGEVQEAWIQTRQDDPKQSRGFGYVVMKSEDDAEKAKTRFNNTVQFDRMMMVSHAIKPGKDTEEGDGFKLGGKRKGGPGGGRAKKGRNGPPNPKRRKTMPVPKIKGSLKELTDQLGAMVHNACVEQDAKRVRSLWKTVHQITELMKNPENAEQAAQTKKLFPELIQKIAESLKTASEEASFVKTLRAGGKECKFILMRKIADRLYEHGDTKACSKQFRELEDSLIGQALAWEAEHDQQMDHSDKKSLGTEVKELWKNRKLADAAKQKQELAGRIQEALGESGRVIAFGSSVTTLVTEKGDLDLGVDFGPSAGEAPNVVTNTEDFMEFSVKNLQAAQKLFYSKSIKTKLVSKTRVPILKVKKTAIPCEISVHKPDDVKRYRLLSWVCNELPHAGPFLLAIKHWASSRGLTNTFLLGGPGSLNSFGFVMVGIAALKALSGAEFTEQLVTKLGSTEVPGSSHICCEQSAWPGDKLANFDWRALFERFFALLVELEPRTQMISARQGGLAAKSEAGAKFDVFVEDPVDPRDNPARYLTGLTWKRIRREAMRARQLLGSAEKPQAGFLEKASKSGKGETFKAIRQLFF